MSHHSEFLRLVLFTGIMCSGLQVFGCSKTVETETEATTITSTTAGPSASETDDSQTGSTTNIDLDPDQDGYFDLSVHQKVDILVVMDNSGSMAEEQGVLSRDIGVLVDMLEAKGADFHMGFTSTDMGNPRCGATADLGRLQLSSCRGDRLDADFRRTTQGGDLLFDARFACLDHCPQAAHDKLFAGVSPTQSEKGDGSIARRWIESSQAATNLPAGVSAADAFRCFAPQGITGCGFESTLEAVYAALEESQVPDSANYGFLRDSATLAILVVTDEYDCSYNPSFNEIFTPANKAFWTDQGANAAQNAVCWNAGTKCVGDPPFTCEAADYSSDATEIANPNTALDNAVLFPVARYIDTITALEQSKQLASPMNEVLVTLIGGVPIGYENGAEPLYAAGSFDDMVNNGIGPSCVSLNKIPVDPSPCAQTAECPAGAICNEQGVCSPPNGDPLPAVRMLEWAEALTVNDTPNVFSICSDDYKPALATVADQINEQIQPACYPGCAADFIAETPVVDPQCEVFERGVGNMTPIEPCLELAGELLPPNGESVCYGLRVDVDGTQTPTTTDNMSAACVEQGFNLEFFVVQAPGELGPAAIEVKCEHSAMKATDCPLL